MHPRSPASVLAARSLLGLPPRLRTRLYRNAPSRLLNPSQVRCASLAEAWAKTAEQMPLEAKSASGLAEGCLNLSWGLLELLHNLGLTWAVALPASALVVRAFIIMPLFQVPARKAQQTNAALMPLTQAYAIVQKHYAHQAYYLQGPRVARDMSIKRMTVYNHKIRKRWRAQRWRQMLPFMGLPVFIAMAETIRRMLGARSGLWGLVFGSDSYQSNPPKASDPLSGEPTTDAIADAVEKVAEWKGTTSLPSAVPDTAVMSAWLEPSLATEGMLWFPNLMAPDPLMILPFAVSGLTLATLYTSSKNPGKGKEKPAYLILKRLMMTFGLAIGPLTLNMPAGILLYWASSTSCAFLSHVFLDHFHPIRMPPKPCKRTIPYYPKKKAM